MPQYYPVLLDVTDKPVVIVGGGLVSQRKLRLLLDSDARVTVIAPEATERIRAWAGQEKIAWVAREYREGDLAGAWLAIIGTDDPAVNRLIVDEAHARHILVNTVDSVENCDFIVPAVVQRGDLTLAISTGAGSPAMARFLREELERLFPPEYAQLLQVLSEARAEVHKLAVSPGSERWQQCIDDELKALVRAGDLEAAKSRLVRMLAQPS